MSATITLADDPIARARDAAMPDAAQVATYRAYVLGTQPVTLSAEMQADLAGVLGNGYVHNLCKRAVQSANDFLSLARIDIRADESAERDALAAFLDDLWVRNQVDELAGDVHFATLRDGNYAVEVSWDDRNQRVRLGQLDWWNGTRGVFVHYDEGGLADWAVYEWQEEDPETRQAIGRRVVYYPNRLERFRRAGLGAWEMYNLPDDPVQGGHPVPWTFPSALGQPPSFDGEPIGIPIVHFPNLLVPNHQPGTTTRETGRRYGRSLLAGGPLGVQDAKNEISYDIIAAARRTAFPVYTATGVGVPLDPETKKPMAIVVTPGTFLSNPDKDARYSILNAGDMSQLLAIAAYHDRVFGLDTNTPMQAVADTEKDLPSGVAMWRQQLDAVRQAQRGAIVFGARWGMAFHKATVVANAFGRAELNADLMLVGAFDPIEVSDVAALAEVAQMLRDAGMPMRYVAKVLGMTEQQADELVEWLQEEQAFASGLATQDAGATALGAELQGRGEA